MDDHKLHVPLVTPKYWGAFRLTQPQQEVAAYYHPAFNQIWINTNVSKPQQDISLLHENLHGFTLCCQAPQFYAIQSELLGIVNSIPNAKHFSAIVESVCMTYLLVYLNLEVKEEFLVGGNSNQKDLAIRMIRISREIAKYTHPDLSEQLATREALNALCQLLMHIIPYDKCEDLILDLIAMNPPPQNWRNNRQLLHYYYAEMQKLRFQTVEYSNVFDINYLENLHRHFLDMVIILAKAIDAIPIRWLAVVAVFPILLLIVTLRCFRFATIHYMESSGNKKYKIYVDHVTQRSLPNMRSAAKRQKQILKESEEKGMKCHAAETFLYFSDLVTPFVISNSPNRAGACFKASLNAIPGILEHLMNARILCPQCQSLQKSGLFLWAYHTIRTMPEEIREEFYQAADNYEDWLLNHSPNLMQGEMPFPTEIKPIRCYKYL